MLDSRCEPADHEASSSQPPEQTGTSGPFKQPVNALLSRAFGQPIDGITVTKDRDHESHLMGATAFTKGNQIGLSSQIRQEVTDGQSMEVLAHEVAHALAPTTSPHSLLDRHGDPGEDAAYDAGRVFRHYVESGAHGPVPKLQPAHGGRALIHRHQIQASFGVKDPAHESMTALSLQRAGLLNETDGYKSAAAWDYTRGAMWNDDPDGLLFDSNRAPSQAPFRMLGTGITNLLGPFSTGAEWLTRFSYYERQAEKRSHDPSKPAFGMGDPLLARTHFGDMSFLHGMASHEGEKAEDTKTRMMMWAEFNSKVALGEIPADAKLSDIKIPGFEMFAKDKRIQGKSVAEFFGCGPDGGDVKKRAQGSLLHMIQDSYAGGHAEREMVDGKRGPIARFHAYSNQDHKKHGRDDAFISDEDAKDPKKLVQNIKGGEEAIEDGATVLKLLNKKGANWTEIQQHLDRKTFALQKGSEKNEADAGAPYEKSPDKEHGILRRTLLGLTDAGYEGGLGVANKLLDAKDWLMDSGGEAWGGIKRGLGRAQHWVGHTRGEAWGGIRNSLGRAKSWLGQTSDEAWGGISNGQEKAQNWLQTTVGQAGGGISKRLGMASAWLTDASSGMGDAYSEGRLGRYLGHQGKQAFGGVKNSLSDTVDFLKEKGGEAWGGIKNTVGGTTDFMKKKGGEAWGGIKDTLGGAKDLLKEKGSEAWAGIKDTLGGAKNFGMEKGSEAWTGTKQTLFDAKDFVKEKGGEAWGGIKELGQSIWNRKKEGGQGMDASARNSGSGAKELGQSTSPKFAPAPHCPEPLVVPNQSTIR